LHHKLKTSKNDFAAFLIVNYMNIFKQFKNYLFILIPKSASGIKLKKVWHIFFASLGFLPNYTFIELYQPATSKSETWNLKPATISLFHSFVSFFPSSPSPDLPFYLSLAAEN